jgi:serine/threonine protein kinase
MMGHPEWPVSAGGVVSEDLPGSAGGLLAGFGPGSRVAGYVLEDQIGVGGMAVVFRARDERLQRRVALKLLAPALARMKGSGTGSSGSPWRRRSTTRTLSRCTKRARTGECCTLRCGTCPEGTYRSLLRREGPLSPARAAAVISPVASALDAAHAAGLVHRDVKPANMLLDARSGRPDHVYLSDFGLSKGALTSAGITGSGQYLGTPDYSAPEQIQGGPVGGRTDQYALACAAFELLTGEAPFSRDQGLAVIWAHLSEPPPALSSRRPGLPRRADQVLARALAKAPEDRYGSCGEFADALRGGLGLAPYDSGPGAIPPAGHPATQIAGPAGPGTGPAARAIGPAPGGADIQTGTTGIRLPADSDRPRPGPATIPQPDRRRRRLALVS